MNETCHAYEWVMSHIWISHVTHISSSHGPFRCFVCVYAWVTSHIWMSHVAHMNSSCHTFPHPTNPFIASSVYMNESRHTYEWVMLHIWISHVANISSSHESFHCFVYVCEWVMSRIWMSHVAHMNETCHACFLLPRTLWLLRLWYKHDMPHQSVRGVALIRTTRHIHMRVVPHRYVWGDALVYLTSLIHACDTIRRHVWGEMSNWYAWHDLRKCDTWLTPLWISMRLVCQFDWDAWHDVFQFGPLDWYAWHDVCVERE